MKWKIQNNLSKRKPRVFSERNGLSTIYASLLSLLIVFLLLTILANFFTNYNTVIQDQMKVTELKEREALSIKDAVVSNNAITNILVENTGTVEIKVRAIYLKTAGATTFVNDPSTSISPNNYADIALNPPASFSSNYSIFAATERGTLSKEYLVQEWEKMGYSYDSENLTIGPMRLKFESFEYSEYSNGEWGDWTAGWSPKVNIELKWKVTVTNVGVDTLELNNHTALSLWDPPSEIPWYIENPTVTISANEKTELVFFRKTPYPDNSRQKIAAGLKGTSTMVFLNFFGKIILQTGEERSYGQTIPFEAVVPRS